MEPRQLGDPLRSDTGGSALAPASFERCYSEMLEPLTRTAFLLCGSSGTAEEITQDVFEGAFRRWDDIADPASYLRTAVFNRAKNVYRSRDREHPFDASRVDTVSVEIVELRASLLRLPHRQRAVVVLRYYVGLSDPEIADLLQCKRSTVRSSAKRAMTALRREFSS